MRVLANLRHSFWRPWTKGPSAGTGTGEADAIRRSGLFDAVWYLEQNPDAAAFGDPVAHYIAVGGREGQAPHPLFDADFYQAANPDLSGFTPLGHFVLLGEATGATPSPLFDPAWYAVRSATPKGRRAGLFQHFLREGALAGLSPHPAFDPAYYRSLCPDAAEVNPLTHFVGAGARQELSPSPFFDLRWYQDSHEQVIPSGLNPLAHFLRFGAHQGLQPHPEIDLVTYRASHAEAPNDPLGAFLYLAAHETPDSLFASRPTQGWRAWADRLTAAKLFDPDVYRDLNEARLPAKVDPQAHFASVGLQEGFPFTNPAMIAERIATLTPTLEAAGADYLARLERGHAAMDTDPTLIWFREKAPRIGVFCNTAGNFYMLEIADLLAEGLRNLGIQAAQRDENASRDEVLDLRIFVAPHEFFFLGNGRTWRNVVVAPGTVLYNVEQMQTPWFCQTFRLLLTAPLLLDINFQTAAIMRDLGRSAVHFMPGHMPNCPLVTPDADMSDIELAQGYDFAHSRDAMPEDRPIDILFVGASGPRRDKVLASLLDLTDDYRFACIYKPAGAPLTLSNQRASSGRINSALAQRSKIVLNIYRDWLGYFDWSRILQQGLWQGACVVSDPGMPHPIYRPGEHFLEEPTRHLRELIRWLLSAPDGRATRESTQRAGFARARELGAMRVVLLPVLDELQRLLTR